MTLKEEFEILRGEPIEIFSGDPMSIPCIETSDADKLCRHPVVSVNMTTYNHEPYIRQAIEGVMMQKTDFEFELVIGEDCSQDKTREICFEYQKKYPDKIRVLWWHGNVLKLGGNSRRVRARSRGEFVALCEGDDYWIDPLKLQKQVDVMRAHPNVGLVYTNGYFFFQSSGERKPWDENGIAPYGLTEGKQFIFYNIFSHAPLMRIGCESYLLTASALIRSSTLKIAMRKFEIFYWRLRLGDVQMWLGLAACADVFGIEDATTVYRRHNGGACASLKELLWRDNLLVRIYFNKTALGLTNFDLPPVFTSDWAKTSFASFSHERFFNRFRFFIRFYSNETLRQMTVTHGISRKVAEYYSRYCKYELKQVKWNARDRFKGRFAAVIRLFSPSCLKKFYRKIMRRGEFSDRTE